jgi:DnaK suppressor protein
VLERQIAEASSAHFIADARETRYALRRLDDGTYGICARCGDPIPFERLEAIPHARRCVRCPDEPAGLIG